MLDPLRASENAPRSLRNDLRECLGGPPGALAAHAKGLDAARTCPRCDPCGQGGTNRTPDCLLCTTMRPPAPAPLYSRKTMSRDPDLETPPRTPDLGVGGFDWPAATCADPEMLCQTNS